jgi:hypothetical protein
MCSYCHEFVKRNQPICGYCNKIFPIVLPKKDIVIKERKFRKTVVIAFLLGIAIIFGITAGKYIRENFFLPQILDTIKISEPINLELVELEPSPHSWQH